MVLGLRSRHRKGVSFQVDYLVHVREIKPWPPSQSLSSVQSVLLQWENGDQNSGSFTSDVRDAEIEFNESFILPLTLVREKKSHDKFQKNCLEFHLYETRKDKAGKVLPLGTVIINLADYGIIEESLNFSAPVNLKKSSKNTAQPVLFVKIEPIDKESSNSSPKSSVSKEYSIDKDGQESVSEIMNEENDVESEIASFTDDDVSSHSSRTIASSTLEVAGASPYRNEKDELESAMESTGKVNGERGPTKSTHVLSSTDLSSNLGNPVNNHAYLSKYPDRDMTSIRKVSVTPPIQSISSSAVYRDANEELKNHMRSFEQESTSDQFQDGISSRQGKIEENAQKSVKETYVDRISAKIPPPDPRIGKEREIEQDEQNSEEKRQSLENKQVGKVSQDTTRRQGTLRSNTLMSSRRAANNKLKHMTSVLPLDSANANEFPGNIQKIEKVKKIAVVEATQNIITSDVKTVKKEPTNGVSDDRTEWKSRVQMLEEELREAAAIEVGLYSIVAEHGSSVNKVHAPARRLSRFYLHAFKSKSEDKRASAARATVSGLVLVSKACGNDVPRLTFWLSNSIMLRGIISQAVGEIPLSDGPRAKSNAAGSVSESRPLRKRNDISSIGKEKTDSIEEGWEDPKTFAIALENIEAWIFSRIIESVWWQTLTPHMQSTAAKSSKSLGISSRKNSGSRKVLSDQEQGNFSVELWKKAFKDACERLCPIRAGGHECGCLPVARLVMEQLVSRLDVAMFNAILRESAEEMPTDPVSDPIGDSKVLPIPAGKSSFGAGAQLKNAIGNWSRWLTDLFGIEDNDFHEDNNNLGDEKKHEFDTPFKPFRLLNALSDLMMLPFEMLADVSARKEVCPTLGAPLIKRVVYNFVPDEFCPHPIPDSVLHALDSEDALEAAGESLTSFPCIATPTIYAPPPAASLTSIIGQVGNQALQRSSSSVLKKAYTSDDELDELDSPLTSIVTDNLRISSTLTRSNGIPKGKGGRNVVRYKLLREVWRDGE